MFPVWTFDETTEEFRLKVNDPLDTKIMSAWAHAGAAHKAKSNATAPQFLIDIMFS